MSPRLVDAPPNNKATGRATCGAGLAPASAVTQVERPVQLLVRPSHISLPAQATDEASARSIVALQRSTQATRTSLRIGCKDVLRQKIYLGHTNDIGGTDWRFGRMDGKCRELKLVTGV